MCNLDGRAPAATLGIEKIHIEEYKPDSAVHTFVGRAASSLGHRVSGNVEERMGRPFAVSDPAHLDIAPQRHAMKSRSYCAGSSDFK
jgi:hypothetical protein